MIQPEVIERIRAETDIVELIGGYLPLRKVGRNYRALCPFHPDSSPSFYVSPERQTYHCFGCGAGGNVVSFVMAQEKLDFPEAMKLLAERLGIEVSFEQSDRNQHLYEACENAARFFERQLSRTEKARTYLAARGLKREVAGRFRLGYAPGGNRLRGEARRQSWGEKALVDAGLLARRDDGLGDYFYDRLMFPLLSLSGRVVGFTGRVLDDREPKYLNSPETAVFHKGRQVYGLFQAKGHIREAVPLLVEGNFDVISLVQAGFANAVAPLGTALTEDQARLLRRFNRRVLVCFDGDPAGHKAMLRALEVLLKSGLEPQLVVLPAGSDPDDLVRNGRQDVLTGLVDRPVDFVDFVATGYDGKTVLGQRAALRQLVGLVRQIPDQATRELYVNRLAERFGVSRGAVLESGPRPAISRPVKRGGNRLAERLVAMMVQEAELARIAGELGLVECIEDEELKAVAELGLAHCETPGYGAAMVLDRVEDQEMKKRVAGWTFSEQRVLPPEEFRAWAARLRAGWLVERIRRAHEQGREEEVELLTRERGKLLSGAARERSDSK